MVLLSAISRPLLVLPFIHFQNLRLWHSDYWRNPTTALACILRINLTSSLEELEDGRFTLYRNGNTYAAPHVLTAIYISHRTALLCVLTHCGPPHGQPSGHEDWSV